MTTAHLDFAASRQRSGAQGDDEWFGISAAVLAGDLAFVFADDLLDELTCDPAVARAARHVYSQLRREVIAGQYLDLRAAGTNALPEEALKVALLKSGRYTVTRPLELGATLGRAGPRTMALLRTYGDALGVAFQLRDDVLGIFGEPQAMGKGASDDLQEGKATLLLVRALELSTDTQRALLGATLGRRDADPSSIDACRDVIAASGALASVERLIEAKLDEALSAVDELHSPADAALAEMAHALVQRVA
jgi:geranylgeranyl diphosphate synthase type I